MKALHEDFVNQTAWQESYLEEKNELIENSTYMKISLQEYHYICRLSKRVPKAIPSMCVMTIKQDERLASNSNKSPIVVLGNLRNRL